MKKLALLISAIGIFGLVVGLDTSFVSRPSISFEPNKAAGVLYCMYASPSNDISEQYIEIFNESSKTQGSITLKNQTLKKTYKFMLPPFSYQVVDLSVYHLNFKPSIVTIRTLSPRITAFALVSYINGITSGSPCYQSAFNKAALLNISTTVNQDFELLIYNPTNIPTILSGASFLNGQESDLPQIDGLVVEPRSSLLIDLRQLQADESSLGVIITSRAGLFILQGATVPTPESEVVPSFSSRTCLFSDLKTTKSVSSLLWILNPTQNAELIKIFKLELATKLALPSENILPSSNYMLNFSGVNGQELFGVECNGAKATFATAQIVQNDLGIPLTFFIDNSTPFAKSCLPGALNYTGSYWLIVTNPTAKSFNSVIKFYNPYGIVKDKLIKLDLKKYQVVALNLPRLSKPYGIIVQSPISIVAQTEYDNPFGNRGTVVFNSQSC